MQRNALSRILHGSIDLKRMPVRLLLVASILVGCMTSSFGQDLMIRRASSPVKVDAVMDEQVWQEADIATDFNQYFPFDTSLAMAQTEVRMTYDDHNIYVIAVMHNLGPRDYVAASLRRDYRGRGFDGFTVVLDTYQDKTNAFVFGVNPYGVQREGLITNGGNPTRSSGSANENNSFTLIWDNKWYAEAKIYDDYWIAEIAIPFRTIRFKDNLDTWNINFYRVDSEYTERSTWSPIPRNFQLVNLGYNKELMWDQPPGTPGKNISLIPYTAFRTEKDFEEGTPTNNQWTIGGDAKVALTSALNLDLTFNPDFSQVEADQQVTNLDRFEIFFPEQRQFFLENADLFAAFGSDGARPFFSRRIGTTQDTSTGTNLSNQLYMGARMSGNLSSRTRIGVMSIQAAEEDDIGLPSINYSVASLQHRMGQRSNISAIVVSKQAFQDTLGAPLEWSSPIWNRVAGLDLNLATPDNRWNGKAYYHQSFDNLGLNDDYSAGMEANYETFRWQARADIRNIGANFNPEVGFVRRTDFTQMRGTIYHNFYPGGGAIQAHAPGFDFDVLGNDTYGLTDWDLNVLYRIEFQNNARFRMRLRRQYTYLFEPFDPSGTGGQELAEDTDYTYDFVVASYSSDERRNFFYELSTISGAYFNGSRVNLEGTLSYRFGLRGTAAMNFEFNRIRLPEGFNDANLILVGPRFDITFTRNVFWTTFIQYNNQISNVNINTRFQWRFKPVSDLFVVYTDNYLAGENDRIIDFSRPKARALVVKVSYWFNL